MSDKPKTSTFTVHHDRCDPGKWTAHDVIAFADFIRTGDLRHAARLSRLGVQLVMSEHHTPLGGTLQRVGWATESDTAAVYEEVSEAIEMAGDNEVTPLHPMYRGPAEYVIKIGIGDGDGNFEGYEYDFKPTEAEANELAKSLLP